MGGWPWRALPVRTSSGRHTNFISGLNENTLGIALSYVRVLQASW